MFVYLFIVAYFMIMLKQGNQIANRKCHCTPTWLDASWMRHSHAHFSAD